MSPPTYDIHQKRRIFYDLTLQNLLAIMFSMKKSEIIRVIGNAPAIAKRLEYAHRNVVYGWPDELSERQSADVIRRMKVKRIPIPKEWK